MNIFSFSPFGYEGSLVTVEVDLRRGIPAVDLVGLADGAVKESRERMRSAIRNSGFDFPLERVLISLSPADLKKEGAGFDLAIALAVLDAQKRSNQSEMQEDLPFDNILIMGELELSGQIRPVRGVHGAAATAKSAGINMCIVSSANGDEARQVSGMKVFAASSLAEAFDALYRPELFKSGVNFGKNSSIPENSVFVEAVLFAAESPELEFSDIKGQSRLVRALTIAAAGGHNLLAFGPPGCGKTLAIQKFPALLPLLTVEEAQSVTRIYSIAGLLSPTMPLMRGAPFRVPHQTASVEGMCGGGVLCRPGEISLSHNGVLFLDEAAEFRSSVLQMLRVPIESGKITLSRAGRSTVYPANFQLLMATNPCPCGNYGVPGKICLCSARSIELYWKKFSGPLLDRIDLRVAVSIETSEKEISRAQTTSELRKTVAKAVKIQRTRQGKRNVHLTPQEIILFCSLGEEEKNFLDNQTVQKDFSQRAVSGCLKLARTIADMEGAEKISCAHLKEAVSFRVDAGPLSCAYSE